jgi:hypothetical protein
MRQRRCKESTMKSSNTTSPHYFSHSLFTNQLHPAALTAEERMRNGLARLSAAIGGEDEFALLRETLWIYSEQLRLSSHLTGGSRTR